MGELIVGGLKVIGALAERLSLSPLGSSNALLCTGTIAL